MRRRGFTLVEMLIALGISVLGVLLVLSVIPTALLTLRRGEDLQTATACATRLLEESQQSPPRGTGLDREEEVYLNGTRFTCTRQVIIVDVGLVDVIATVRWRDDNPPVRMATRIAVRVKPP